MAVINLQENNLVPGQFPSFSSSATLLRICNDGKFAARLTCWIIFIILWSKSASSSFTSQRPFALWPQLQRGRALTVACDRCWDVAVGHVTPVIVAAVAAAAAAVATTTTTTTGPPARQTTLGAFMVPYSIKFTKQLIFFITLTLSFILLSALPHRRRHRCCCRRRQRVATTAAAMAAAMTVVAFFMVVVVRRVDVCGNCNLNCWLRPATTDHQLKPSSGGEHLSKVFYCRFISLFTQMMIVKDSVEVFGSYPLHSHVQLP